MIYNVYFAAPLFSEMEQFYNAQVAKRIRKFYPEINLFLPQEQDEINDKESYADAKQIAHYDTQELLKSDLLIAVLDGPVIDPGVASEIGVAYMAEIPILGLYTDSRQQGATNQDKLDALQTPGENQFHYINLYTMGLVKEGGRLVTSARELVDTLGLYLKEQKPSDINFLDYAREVYGLKIEGGFGLMDYTLTLDDHFKLTYTLPLTKSFVKHPLVMSFRNVNAQISGGDHPSILACYNQTTQELFSDLHDPGCSSFTFDFYNKIFHLFLDLLNQHIPYGKSYPLDTSGLQALREIHEGLSYNDNFFELPYLLDEFKNQPGELLNILEEVIVPRLTSSDKREGCVKGYIQTYQPLVSQEEKKEIVNNFEGWCLNYLAEILDMLARYLEVILEDQDYIYQK